MVVFYLKEIIIYNMKYYFEDEEKNLDSIKQPEEEVVNENQQSKGDDYVMKLPDSEKDDDRVVEPNKAAHWSMRIAGALIDICLIFLGLMGFRYLFNMTPMGTALNDNNYAALRISDDYKLQHLVEGSDETFGHKLYEGEEKYDVYIKNGYLEYQEEDTLKKYVVVVNDNPSKEIQSAFSKAVNADERFKNYTFNARLIEFGIVAISGTCSEIIFVLAIPLISKKRQTIGKMAAGTMVINSHYQSEAKWYQMLGRFFFILIIESLIPCFFISSVIWTPVVVSIILFLISLTNKDRRTIHDFVCRTKVINKRTFVKLADQ